MSITLKQLAAATWKLAYDDPEFGLRVFTAEEIDGVAIVHHKKQGKPTRIVYRVHGKNIDGPSAAVRAWNEEEKYTKVGFAQRS